MEPELDEQKIAKVLARLTDDYHRQGAYLGEDEVLQAFEKFRASVAETSAIRSALKESGIEIDGEGLLHTASAFPEEPPTGVTTALAPATDDSFELFLRELGHVDLLSPEQVITLMRRIRAAEQAAVALSIGAGDDSGSLALAVKMGDVARAEFVRANLPLVLSIAKHYAKTKSSMDISDLVQEGSMGLMRAVDKFDHTKGFRFSTYATYWIRQNITRALADKDRLIRLPVWVVDQVRRIRRTTWALTVEKGAAPSAQEIAVHLNCDAERVQFFVDAAAFNAFSLQDTADEDNDTLVEEFVAPPSSRDPETLATARRLVESVLAAVADLKPKEQQIIRMRFGLEGDETYTLQEIGEQFGVTRERIRQIESKVLERLRHPSRAAVLSEFLERAGRVKEQGK